MRDCFLALRDSFRNSGRDWFPILFFSARVLSARYGNVFKKIIIFIDLILLCVSIFLVLRGLPRLQKYWQFFNERSLGNNLGLVDPYFQKTFLKSTETSEELF